ncbi:adenine deaminase [Pseudahrensia aquimaris]|uniref:Adenine deaminase n=1 Tax=Pseudahrensia aquimaris TaxID=744461 RepID=A0ABW3FDA8_9HYPH
MSETINLNDPDLRSRAVRAAQGYEPFDVLIANGTLFDGVTGQLRAADVGLIGPLIASVHPTASRDDARKTVDASGCILSPGLIDMHMHIESSMITPSAYAAEVLPRGVTTLVWDPHEFGNTCGVSGVDYAVQAAKDSPMNVLTLAPSCVPSAPGYETTGGDFTADIVASLLANPDIHGVAEVMSMQALLDRDERMSCIVQAGLDAGKRVCGHARSLTGGALNAYAASGVETDHELTSGADLVEKLQMGLTIELRGSHDHLLPQFVEELNRLGQLPQTLTLCTDDVFIDDLVAAGGLDDVVRRLVKYGLKPEWALQAATFNAANRLGRSDLGLIAPGKRADISIFDNLETFRAKAVFANGVCIAENGSLISPLKETEIPSSMYDTMKIKPVCVDDFRVSARGKTVTVATIEKPRFTQWGRREVDVVDGFASCPPDMIKMAIINRFGTNEAPRIAYLSHWGTWRGAFATTVSHDSHNLTVFGGNEKDMAVAANAVIEAGGGLAAASQGRVLEVLALPVAGLASSEPTADLAERFQKIRSAMDEIVDWEPPYLVFKACFGASLVCNAGPHLSDIGIVDTHQNVILKSPIEAFDAV